MNKIELMEWTGDAKVVFEEQEDGSLLIETVPSSSSPFEEGQRIFLDEVGKKRLRKFLIGD